MARHMREASKDRGADRPEAEGPVVYLGPDKPEMPRERHRRGHVERWEVVSAIVVPILVTLCVILADMASRGRLGW